MKKSIQIIAVLSLLAFAAACNRNELPAPEESLDVIQVTVSGYFPEALEAATKVTLDSADSLVWEAEDAVSLLIGGDSSQGARSAGNNSLSLPLYTALDDIDGHPKPGIFKGAVSFSPFSQNDIRGVVYPYNPGHYFRRQWSGGTAIRNYRIGMAIGGTVDAAGNYTQKQARPGVLNGSNIALFTLFTIEDAEDHMQGDRLTFEGMEFQWGCSLLRFNIYGKAFGMEDGEVLKSITLHPDGAALAGEQEWNYTYEEWSFTGEKGKDITVVLEDSEGATLADKTSANGVKVYMGVRTNWSGTLGGGSYLSIVTDKKTYKMGIAPTLDLKPGVMSRVGINLAECFPEPYVVKGTEYSTDNATWSETLPATFTALYVKGNSDEAVLNGIREAIDQQSAPVVLDMSGADFETAIFPAVFANCTKIKSVKFQSNITQVSAKAFLNCSALAEASLENITAYGDSAFMATSLKSVRLDNNVTSLGIRSFANIYTLESVYFNSTDPVLKETSNSTRKDFRTFQWENADRDTHNVDLVATVGPDSRMPRYMFANNGNLTKLVFEDPAATVRQGNQGLYYNSYLRFVQFKSKPYVDAGALVNYIAMSGSTESTMGTNVTLPKYVIVPDGYKEIYTEMCTDESTSIYYVNNQLMRILVKKSGFTVIEESEVPSDPTPQPAEFQWSADGVNWSDSAPATFSSLYIQGELNQLALSSIKEAISAQAVPVALDLSQATYEVDDKNEVLPFPNVFAGTTSSAGGTEGGGVVVNPGTRISSIKFPSNVKEIAASAFLACDKLTEVDFTGITKIGASAFRATAFTTLTLPSTITSIGGYAFGYIWSLTELHFNCVLESAGSQIFALRNSKLSYDDNPEHYKAGNFSLMTAYIGAGATIPEYAFDTNYKLNKVVFEGKPASTGNAWLIRTCFLETIDCTAITDAEPYLSGGGNSGEIGQQVTGEKKILVPAGRKADFYGGLWKTLVDNNGYVIDDGTVPQNTLPNPNWDNEDTPWKRGSGE